MTDKHFTRKSNLVFPSFVPISKQSNTNPRLTQLLRCACTWALPRKDVTSDLPPGQETARCFLWFWVPGHTIGNRAKTWCIYIFFFPVNVLFFITGQLNSFTELLHCSQRWLQHELATAMGNQRHEIQYNSSFAYIHQVPNVLRQSFVKFMLPIHHCYCLKVAQPGLYTLHSCLWCSVDIPSGLVWIRISVMIVAE